MAQNKIVIGSSDYTREEIEKGTGWSFGVPDKYYLDVIKDYEDAGYVVEFKTNLLRRIFALGIYKVVAIKK